MKRLIIPVFLLCLPLWAQVEYSSGSNNTAGLPMFSVDVVNYKSSEPNKTAVDFFFQVPYSEIQFRKRNETFFGSYNVTLTFMDKDKENIISERSWKEQVLEKNFDKTLSRTNYNFSYRSFNLKPGDYFFRFRIEDLDSRKTATREFPFKVRELSDSLMLSDILLVSEIRKDSTGESIVPNIAKVVTNRLDSLQFSIEVYSNKEQQVHLEYILEDLQAESITKTLDPRSIAKGKNQINFTLHKINFKLGEYNLKVLLKDGDWKEIASAEKKFYSKIQGMPNSITDIDKAIDQTLYIASPSERDYMSDTDNYNEKLERFLAFWDTKKPNPKVEDNPILYEYYRRVEYSNKNFKGMVEGWRSDMGMIYVTFGPPSNVERHPFDSDSRPYEIWDYYDINKSFVFIDHTGFGDYRLYNPDYSRWPGYRP